MLRQQGTMGWRDEAAHGEAGHCSLGDRLTVSKSGGEAEVGQEGKAEAAAAPPSGVLGHSISSQWGGPVLLRGGQG